MATVHLLTQFVWPDAAPTSIYSEQLADELIRRGHRVRLVGTTGHYRSLARPAPQVEVIRLPTPRLTRGVLPAVLFEYMLVQRSFSRYVRTEVGAGDAVIATSAPPGTPWLIAAIRRRRAHGIYRMHDYYPELVRAVRELPAAAVRFLRRRWDRALARWDAVLKVGDNLGYHGANAQVLPDWAPYEFTAEERLAHPMENRTALYAGNFGYAHDVASFLPVAEKLHAEGYRLIARGDGPGFDQLPTWIECGPPFPDEATLRAALLRSELHFVAAHPRHQEAFFPSKIWNSLEAGRRVISTGFAGPQAAELERFLATDHRLNKSKMADAVEAVLAQKVGR